MTWDTSKLDKLLKDELSAVETYDQALEKIREYTLAEEEQTVTAIRDEHRDSANQLREQITKLGGKPPSGPGLWGSWSKLVMGGVKMMGEEATLQALREGEEDGIEDYQDVLKESDIPQDVRELIQSTLLPRQQQHIQVLDQLKKAA